MMGLASETFLGRGQYRNAVASGGSRELLMLNVNPTLPRYGTDLLQQEL